MSEPRRAPRLVVNAPAVIESIGQASMLLHPNLARVFRRVDADKSSVGTKFPAMIRDLSTNAPGAPTPENLPGIVEVAKRNGLTSPLF